MSTLPGINAELAGAIRAVNAAYHRLPEDRRPEPPSWDALSREVDAACAAGDRSGALAAIRAWSGHWLSAFEKEAP